MPNVSKPFTVIAGWSSYPESEYAEMFHTLAYSKHKAVRNVRELVVRRQTKLADVRGHWMLDAVRIIAVFEGHQKNIWE